MGAAQRRAVGNGTVRLPVMLRIGVTAVILLWGAGTGMLVTLPGDTPVGLVALHATTAGLGMVAVFVVHSQRLRIRDGVLTRRRTLSVAGIPVDRLALLDIDDGCARATLMSTDSRPLMTLDLTIWPAAAVERLLSGAGVRVVHATRTHPEGAC